MKKARSRQRKCAKDAEIVYIKAKNNDIIAKSKLDKAIRESRIASVQYKTTFDQMKYAFQKKPNQS
jgi:hypothetical protein